MQYNFQIKGLDPAVANSFFEMNDEQLKTFGAMRVKADTKPGYPCRLSLQDAEVGEDLILCTFPHHQVDSPYQASGPIFIRNTATPAQLKPNEIPLMLQHRFLSLRAYDKEAMMRKATTVDGGNLYTSIQAILANQEIDYIHIHNAGPGCYNCKVLRID